MWQNARMAEMTSIAFPAAAGVNMADTPVFFGGNSQMAGRYIQQAGNMRIENNRWRTAWRWKELAPVHDEAFDAWVARPFQNAIWYLPRSGQGVHYLGTGNPRIVESAGGRMFTLEVRGNQFQVKDISGGIETASNLMLAWLCQGENYVVRTDGASTTQIWDGKNDVFLSPGYNASVKERSRFPNQAGPVCYAGGRFWVTTFGRQIIAGDSLHQYNLKDATDIIRFEDQTYDYLNVAFFPPADDGDVVALTVSINAGFQDSRAQGEVLTMCDGPSVWAIALGVAREQWGLVQMRTSRSKETAATGPDAFYVRDGDILMRTPLGIQSLNLLAGDARAVGNPAVDLGADMRQIMERDYEPDLLFASLINPTRWDRMMCTVQPRVNGPLRSHLGYIAANWNPLSVRQPQGYGWEGLQCLPPELGQVIKFLPTRINGETLVYALLLKPDGTKALAQLLQQDGPHLLADGTPLDRQWYLMSKKLMLGGQWRTSTARNLMVLLEDMRSDVNLEIWVRTDIEPDFVLRATKKIEASPHCQPSCIPKGERQVVIGDIFKSIRKDWRWVQFLVKGVGVTSIDFGMAGESGGKDEQTPSPECLGSYKQPICGFDPFYPAFVGQ